MFSASAQEIKILSWNVEWMGSPSKCNCDTSIQRQNIETVLNTENPDIVVLQEVVSVRMLRDIARNLGYQSAISPYCSFAADTLDSSYDSGQKLGYLYKPHTTSLLDYGLAKSTYPFLSNTNSPYYFFASGRFPYLHTFRVQKNGKVDTLTLLNLHAKSGTASNNYTRRLKGGNVIIDSLLLQYSGQPVLICGDFNDLMDGSISSASNTPYQTILDAGYRPMFNQDSVPGQSTHIYYSNSLIDNFVMSPSAHQHYKPGSAQILSSVQQYISNYGNTTSDHLPIVCSYFLTDTPAHIGYLEGRKIRIFPNPSGHELNIEITDPSSVHYQVRDMQGRLRSRGQLYTARTSLALKLPPGYYSFSLWHENAQQSFLIYIR